MTPLLTVNDLAAVLRVARPMVYRLINTGELPYVRVGERIRFRPEAVDEYLKRRAGESPP